MTHSNSDLDYPGKDQQKLIVQEMNRQQVFNLHQRAIGNLQKSSNHYDSFKQAVDGLPILNPFLIFNFGPESTEKTGMPILNGQSLVDLVFAATFSVENKIILLLGLFNSGYVHFIVDIFNTSRFIDIMYQDPEWYPFVLFSYKNMLQDKQISGLTPDNEKKLWVYLFNMIIDHFKSSQVTEQQLVKFIHQLIDTQPEDKLKSTYDLITFKLAELPIGKTYLSDIKKMVETRFLKLKLQKQKESKSSHNLHAIKEMETFLKAGQHLFSTTLWDIYKESKVSKASAMLEIEQKKLDESLEKKFNRKK